MLIIHIARLKSNDVTKNIIYIHKAFTYDGNYQKVFTDGMKVNEKALMEI